MFVLHDLAAGILLLRRNRFRRLRYNRRFALLMLKRVTRLMAAAAIGLAQQTPVAISGARIIPIGGPEIPNGVLVVQNGKIVAVGAIRSMSVTRTSKRPAPAA